MDLLELLLELTQVLELVQFNYTVLKSKKQPIYQKLLLVNGCLVML